MKRKLGLMDYVAMLTGASLVLLLGAGILFTTHRAYAYQFPTPTSPSLPTDTATPPPPTDTATPPPPTTSVPPTTPAPPTTPQPTIPSSTPKPPPPGATAKPGRGEPVLVTPSNAAVGWYVYVTKPEGLGLNASPGFGSAYLQTALAGDRLCVIGGPERADTLWWWKLRTTGGAEGWGVSDYVEKTNEQCSTTAAAAAPVTQPGGRRTSALPSTGADAYLVWVGLAGIGLLILVGFIRRRSAATSEKKNI